MKKLFIFFILMTGLVLPWACSDNNALSKPTGPSLSSGSTPTPPSISTPGTATPVPTYAIPTPAYKYNEVTGAAPNAMVLSGANQILVAEGEVTLGGDTTALGSYSLNLGTGALNGTTGGNLVVIGFPTPNSTPPWQGTTITLTMPKGFAYSPAGNTFAILDTAPGGTTGTLYQENPSYPGVFSNYCTSYLGSAFVNPTGLAVDSQGNHFIADSGNHAVEAFKPPSGIGPFTDPGIEHRWFGSNQVAFVQPYALTVDSNDNLWVADPGYNPTIVQEFSPYNALGNNGTTFITAFTTLPNCIAHGISVDQSANCNGVPGPCVYIADVGNHQVEEYTSTGVILRAWTVPVGSYEYTKFLPSCVLLVGNYVVVGDVGNDLLEVFGP